jgi:hypothetical protein
MTESGREENLVDRQAGDGAFPRNSELQRTDPYFVPKDSRD